MSLPEQSALPDVTLTATLELGESVCRIAYHFENRSPSDGFLAVRADDERQPTRRPWAVLRPAGDALLIVLAPPPIPPGIEVYAPTLPFFTRVPAGAALDDYCELTLPVDEWEPYAAPAQSVVTVNVRHALWAMNWIAEPDAVFVQPTRFESLVKTSSNKPTLLVRAFETAQSMPVRRRTDEFYRFDLEHLPGAKAGVQSR